MRRPAATGMHFQFKKNQFKTYRSVRTFHLGAVENLQITEDTEVEFDGYTLQIGNDQFSLPSARGAIKAGWLVPASDTDAVYVPRPAGVVMSPADTAKSKESHRTTGAAVSSGVNVVGNLDSVREAAQNPNAPRRVAAADASMPIVTVDHGVEVGRVNVPNKFERTEMVGNTASVRAQMAGSLASSGNRAEFKSLSDREAALLESEDGIVFESEEDRQAWLAKKAQREQANAEAEMMRQARRAEFGEETMSELQSGGAVPFEEENYEEVASALVAMDTGKAMAPVPPGEIQFDTEPAVVRTSTGIDWDVASNPSWEVRAEDAIDRFGWSKDVLLSIAAVENEACASRIQAFVDKTFGAIKAAKENTKTNVVRTSRGIDWDLANPSHWAARAKEAIKRFGGSEEILRSIAEVETKAVKKRLTEWADKTFGAAETATTKKTTKASAKKKRGAKKGKTTKASAKKKQGAKKEKATPEAEAAP